MTESSGRDLIDDFAEEIRRGFPDGRIPNEVITAIVGLVLGTMEYNKELQERNRRLGIPDNGFTAPSLLSLLRGMLGGR